MAVPIKFASDKIRHESANNQPTSTTQSSTNLSSAKAEHFYVSSQNQTFTSSKLIHHKDNLKSSLTAKSSSMLHDTSSQGSFDLNKGVFDTDSVMMSANYHTKDDSPLLVQNLPDTVTAHGLYDKHLPPKSRLGAFLSAFHISRKCRPVVGDQDVSSNISRQGLKDVESCSSSYQANYPWRHKGRRRIQRLSYVLLAYVAGLLALTAFRVGNSHPWYQRGGHVLEPATHQTGSEEFMTHDASFRQKRDVRVEYITLAKNHSEHPHEGNHVEHTKILIFIKF